MTAVQLLVSKVSGHVLKGKVHKAICPCHEDRHQSLEFEQGDKGAKIKCRAGCRTEDVVRALGLEMKDLFDSTSTTAPKREKWAPILETYSYRDEDGTELFQATRHDPKDFKQRRPSGGESKSFEFIVDGRREWRKEPYSWGIKGVRRVLYHLPELIDAQAQGRETVWLPEGEKDVHSFEARGEVATTNPMGADNWSAEYAETLRGWDVVIVRDKDKAGFKRARVAFHDLKKFARSVRCVEAKFGKDATDHFNAGHDLADFVDVDPEEIHPDESADTTVSQKIVTAIDESGLPEIETNNRQLRDMTNEAFDCILLANDPPTVFVRGGGLVRIVENENGRASIQQVTEEIRTGVLARCANFVSTSDRRGKVSVKPPDSVAKDLSMLAPWPGLPTLLGISPCPVVGPDGTIMSTRGYHAPSQTFVAVTEKWPTFRGSGADAAKWLLEEALYDFPIVDDGSKANALALMITPFLRPLITGTIPLFLFDAPVAGTGKTWCAQACLYPGLGLIPAKAPPTKEKEWSDLITTTLSSGSPALLIDNVVGKLDSPSFMALITSLDWTDRLFGKNTVMLEFPNRCIYAITANNAKLEEDFLSRTVPINLDAGMERPQERTEFKHPDVTDWLRENRTRIGAACLAMVRAWLDAGMPKGKHSFSRFSNWASIVAGVLEVCEVQGFLANIKRLQESNDEEHIVWSTLVQEWKVAIGTGDTTSKEIYQKLRQSEALQWILGIGDSDADVKKEEVDKRTKRLGMMLNARKNRVYGDTSIREGTRAKVGRRFKLGAPGDTSVTNTLFGGQREEVSEKGGNDTSPHRPQNPSPSDTGDTRQVQDEEFERYRDDLVSPDEFEEPY